MTLLAGIAFVVGLLAPILYAVDTLSRMQNKRVYPLIRLQGADGRSFTLAVKGANKTSQRATNAWIPVKDTSAPERRIA